MATTTDALTPTEVAAAIAVLPHVERTQYNSVSRKVLVQFPRDRGGRVYMTILDARRFLARS